MVHSPMLLAALATVVGAQVTYDPTSGKFVCPAENPNGAFCAGDSLSTNIIIRCQDGVGQPGNCNDNLAGYFPYGVQFAPCWQSSPTSGIAACSKNCIVRGGSGTYNGTLTLPNCTPIPQSSSTASPTTVTYVQPSDTPASNTTQSSGASASKFPVHADSSPDNGTTTITSTGTLTTTYVTDGTTTTSTSTFTTTYCSEVALPSGAVGTGSIAPSGSGYVQSSNGTVAPSDSHSPATATPVGPTTAPPASTGAEVSNGATANSATAGVCLVALGTFAAYFL